MIGSFCWACCRWNTVQKLGTLHSCTSLSLVLCPPEKYGKIRQNDMLQTVTCAFGSISTNSIFTLAVERSQGIVTLSIHITVVCSVSTFVQVQRIKKEESFVQNLLLCFYLVFCGVVVSRLFPLIDFLDLTVNYFIFVVSLPCSHQYRDSIFRK